MANFSWRIQLLTTPTLAIIRHVNCNLPDNRTLYELQAQYEL